LYSLLILLLCPIAESLSPYFSKDRCAIPGKNAHKLLLLLKQRKIYEPPLSSGLYLMRHSYDFSILSRSKILKQFQK